MTQQEAVKKLKEDPRQAKQFNELAEILNDVFRNEMTVFSKLLQYDVMEKIQERAAADGVTENDAAITELTKALHEMLKQINADLEKEITKKCRELKEKSGS